MMKQGSSAPLEQMANEAATESTASGAPAKPSLNQLMLVGLAAGLPFVGFGFVDNLLMILAGDLIEQKLGAVITISTMAAAGLGNMISDVAGISLGRFVEKLANAVGLPASKLSPAQMALPIVHRTTTLSCMFGISVGCLLGLAPLLFIDSDTKALRDLFNRLDIDHSGTIEPAEVVKAYSMLGLSLQDVEVEHLLDEVGHDGKLDFEEFQRLVRRWKEKLARAQT